MSRFDVSAVLDGVKSSLVVGDTVEMTSVQLRGLRPFTQPVTIQAEAALQGGVVTLNCTYRTTLSLVCDRCLASFDKEVAQRSSHVVVRELNGPDQGEFVVAPDGMVSLEELATNDIIPELPSKVLCREDCRGLCPVCGGNLNEVACGCPTKTADPRLEVLNKLLER